MTIHSSTADTLHDTGVNLADRVMSIIEAISSHLAARRCYRTVRTELEDYSPQLAELGITDADIDIVAEDAALRG
jgi:hypothetical protein